MRRALVAPRDSSSCCPRRRATRRVGWVRPEPDLLDPETNLTLGALYLARLLRRYDGEEAFAVAAYNAGPTAVDRWRERAPHLAALDVVLQEGYPETRRHVAKVLRLRALDAAR